MYDRYSDRSSRGGATGVVFAVAVSLLMLATAAADDTVDRERRLPADASLKPAETVRESEDTLKKAFASAGAHTAKIKEAETEIKSLLSTHNPDKEALHKALEKLSELLAVAAGPEVWPEIIDPVWRSGDSLAKAEADVRARLAEEPAPSATTEAARRLQARLAADMRKLAEDFKKEKDPARKSRLASAFLTRRALRAHAQTAVERKRSPEYEKTLTGLLEALARQELRVTGFACSLETAQILLATRKDKVDEQIVVLSYLIQLDKINELGGGALGTDSPESPLPGGLRDLLNTSDAVSVDLEAFFARHVDGCLDAPLTAPDGSVLASPIKLSPADEAEIEKYASRPALNQ